MTLPTFLGIGVPRGGTTWLHALLETHPEIYMPSRRKEVRFFDAHFEQGTEWYESFFCGPEQRGMFRAVGEVSPQYIYCEDCPRRMAYRPAQSMEPGESPVCARIKMQMITVPISFPFPQH